MDQNFPSISALIILFILILNSGITLASDTNTYSNHSSITYVKYTGQAVLPNYDDFWSCTNPDNPHYNPHVLKTYGSMPTFEDQKQLAIFTNKLREIRDNSMEEFELYMYPSGPIVTYGSYPSKGYFQIEFYGRVETKNDYYSNYDFDSVYLILEKYATDSQIEKLPVVFAVTDNTQLVGFSDWYDENSSFIVHGIEVPPSFQTLQRLEGQNLSESTVIGSSTYDPDIIQGYGAVPEMEYILLSDYSDKLWIINNSVSEQVKAFEYPDGPIKSYAVHSSNGYLVINVTKKFNQKELGELYNIIQTKATEEGIENIPVLFIGSAAETSNLDNISMEGEGPVEGDIETPNAPGFTVLLLVMALFIVFKKQK